MNLLSLVKIATTSVLFIILTSCSSVQVSEDYNFAKKPQTLKTYLWLQDNAAYQHVKAKDPLFHDRVVAAINDTLKSKSYSFDDSPDFLVSYSYEIKTKISSSPSTSVGFGRSRYGSYRGVGFSSSGNDVRQNDYGYLTIDLLDAATKEVFWRGKSSSLVRSHPTPEQTTKEVYEAVAKIFQQLPLADF